MQTKKIVAAIDAEIVKLIKVRDILSTLRTVPSLAGVTSSAKRQLTAEGKARIVAAQKRRWASRGKTAATGRRTRA